MKAGHVWMPEGGRRRVVVTGVGCVCAAGPDIETAMAAMAAGTRRAGPSTRIRTDHGVACPVFEVPDAFLPSKDRGIEEYFRCSRFGVIAAQQAVARAGVTASDLADEPAGVCVGTTVGSALNDDDFFLHFRQRRFPSMDGVRDFLSANPAMVIVRDLGVRGPWLTVTNACSSGTVAIGEAASWVASGLCDRAIAGGTESITRVSYDGFACLMILDPEPCRPFDAERRGLSLGEGAGMLVLESEDSARRRGANILAVLSGYGNACDAFHLSAPHPQGAGLMAAIEQALTMSRRQPHEVAFINAHGTGTVENDRVEGLVFAQHFSGVPYASTKGFTGHALGAAGGIEAAITIQSMLEKRMPGNAGFRVSDAAFDGDPVAETTPVSGDVALSVSVAFGGNNAALIFERGAS